MPRRRKILDNPRDRVESPGQWRSVPRPVDWEARRQAVIARDITCRWVEGGVPCGSIEHLECDHIGDPANHDLANLRALCRRHHRRRTGQQGAAALNRHLKNRPVDKHPGLL